MRRLWKAFAYSIAGVKSAWKDEPAFRLEILLFVVLLPVAGFLAPDKISLLLMIGSMLIVLICELVNTAIEAAVNRIGTERHPFSKKAKDAASAAVLLSLMNTVMVWAVVLF